MRSRACVSPSILNLLHWCIDSAFDVLKAFFGCHFVCISRVVIFQIIVYWWLSIRRLAQHDWRCFDGVYIDRRRRRRPRNSGAPFAKRPKWKKCTVSTVRIELFNYRKLFQALRTHFSLSHITARIKCSDWRVSNSNDCAVFFFFSSFVRVPNEVNVDDARKAAKSVYLCAMCVVFGLLFLPACDMTFSFSIESKWFRLNRMPNVCCGTYIAIVTVTSFSFQTRFCKYFRNNTYRSVLECDIFVSFNGKTFINKWNASDSLLPRTDHCHSNGILNGKHQQNRSIVFDEWMCDVQVAHKWVRMSVCVCEWEVIPYYRIR